MPGSSWYSLAAKGGNEGRWSDVAQQPADERIPLSFDIDIVSIISVYMCSTTETVCKCRISPSFLSFLEIKCYFCHVVSMATTYL